MKSRGYHASSDDTGLRNVWKAGVTLSDLAASIVDFVCTRPVEPKKSRLAEPEFRRLRNECACEGTAVETLAAAPCPIRVNLNSLRLAHERAMFRLRYPRTYQDSEDGGRSAARNCKSNTAGATSREMNVSFVPSTVT
jgi:hypothetical protein